jgi:UDP-N-acetylmuramoyl-L-alanyl-D-glutamate--2,6-diaminopimelate ligase
MGEVAGGADQVWLTNDNPRTEDPAAIAAAVEVGLRDAHARYEIELDRASAIDAALRAATAGDIVVVAGKGHEPDQIIGTTALPFDDRAVVRERWSQIESACRRDQRHARRPDP